MLRFCFVLTIFTAFALISSCENETTDEACRSQVIGCWQVDSLYFRSDVDPKYQAQLKDMQGEVKENTALEFSANGFCKILLQGDLMEGKWSIQDLELRLNLENGSANYFRLLDVDSQQLLVEFMITVEEGVDLPIIQKMRPSQQKIDEMLQKSNESLCIEDPWGGALVPLSPLDWVYFNFSTAQACAAEQKKPLLLCYLDSKEPASNKAIYQVLALPRLQKFMREKLVVAIHFTDMPADLPGAAEQLQQQADSLQSWSAKLPLFVIRDSETDKLLGRISNPRDDLELKRFLIEGLEKVEQ